MNREELISELLTIDLKSITVDTHLTNRKQYTKDLNEDVYFKGNGFRIYRGF